jgi:hypothetical protein
MNRLTINTNEIKTFRNDIINNLINSYIDESYNDDDAIDYYCSNENSHIHNTDDEIWNILKNTGNIHMISMYLKYPKIGDFKKELKKLISDCRKEFKKREEQ